MLRYVSHTSGKQFDVGVQHPFCSSLRGYLSAACCCCLFTSNLKASARQCSFDMSFLWMSRRTCYRACPSYWTSSESSKSFHLLGLVCSMLVLVYNRSCVILCHTLPSIAQTDFCCSCRGTSGSERYFVSINSWALLAAASYAVKAKAG